ncbi:MAG: 3'-5' exonuclease [Burkholderiaceae bacterium]|nr:3'-5' exonuclease [Burkholderiaceae bacterium]
MPLFDWLRSLAIFAPPRDGSGSAGERFVVVDVETTGMDRANDKLLAIGAVALRRERICVGDSFETIIRPERTSERENILVHGIGEQAQREGRAPREACAAFFDWAGNAPLVAFHASFDRGFLARAMSVYLNLPLTNAWLDLAQLAPSIYPDVKARALDDWLDHFGIVVEQRHNASSDAFATAMLFLRLRDALAQGKRDIRRLQRRAAQARWLAR